MRLAVGRIYLRLGRHAEARQSFREVLEQRGEDVRAYIYLGRIALLDGDLAQARRELAAARRADPREFARWMQRILGDQTDAGSEAGAALAAALRASPFTQPGGVPEAAAREGNAWFWYLDASGQTTPRSAQSGDWRELGDAASAHDAEADAEDVSAEFWSSLQGELGEAESDESQADAWWREPASEEEELFSEESEEDASSWLADPLAAFYEELTNTKDAESVVSFGDFSSQAEAERFAGLPPIESRDFEDIDWDQLYARFADEC